MQNAGEHINDTEYKLIADNFFGFVNGLTTVELGSGNGSSFTLHLEKYVSELVCVEFNLVSIYNLRNLKTEKMKVYYEDYHNAVRTIGQYEAVVLFNILHHSHAPLGLLEDVVNYIKPNVILLNAIHNGPIEVVITEEISNLFGLRQVSKSNKCSNLVLSISIDRYKEAMSNMGYECLKTLQYGKNFYAGFRIK